MASRCGVVLFYALFCLVVKKTNEGFGFIYYCYCYFIYLFILESELLTYGDCKAPCPVNFVCSDGEEVALRKGMSSQSPGWVGSSFMAAGAGRQPDPARRRVPAPCFLRSSL